MILPILGGATTKLKANEELLTAFQLRGPNVLDVLIECLKEEEEANKDLIEAIRRGTTSIAVYTFTAYICVYSMARENTSTYPADALR